MNEEGEGEVEWYIELAESIPIPVYIVLVIFFFHPFPPCQRLLWKMSTDPNVPHC
jgi:hypothetical protein